MEKNKFIRSFVYAAVMVFSTHGFALTQSSSLIAAGQSELGPMIDTSQDGGRTWNYVPSLSNFSKQIDFQFNGAPSCAGDASHKVCVASGVAFGNGINFNPGILLNQNAGKEWTQQSIQGLPPYDSMWINSQSCFSKDNGKPRCVITGTYNLPNGGAYQDFIATSDESMSSWTAKPVSGLLPQDYEYEISSPISCAGTGDNTICATSASGNSSSYMITSQDGGNTWSANPVNVSASWVSCTGDMPNTVCVATGLDQANKNIFLVSMDGAKTWTTRIPPQPIEGNILNLSQVSCTGEGASTICAAQGQYYIPSTRQQDPIILVSQDAGNTWVTKPIPHQDFAMLTWLNCAGDNTHGAICAAVGAGLTTNQIDSQQSPYIIVSTDSGNTWSQKNIGGAASLGNFRRVTCNGNAELGTCFAEGVEIPQTNIANHQYQPLIAMSLDQANTWSAPIVQDQPNPLQGILGGVGVQ